MSKAVDQRPTVEGQMTKAEGQRKKAKGRKEHKEAENRN
jgi:hypothetical protein